MISIHYFEFKYRLVGQTRWKQIRILFELRGWKFSQWEETACAFLAQLAEKSAGKHKPAEFNFRFVLGHAEGKGCFPRTHLDEATEYVLKTL